MNHVSDNRLPSNTRNLHMSREEIDETLGCPALCFDKKLDKWMPCSLIEDSLSLHDSLFASQHQQRVTSKEKW